MFSTLRYTPQTRKGESVLAERTQTTQRPSGGQNRQACLHCRAKKLRCSGQKSGCERCLSKNLDCDYPRVNNRRNPRRKQSLIKSVVTVATPEVQPDSPCMNSDVSPNVKPKALKADTNSYFIEEGRFDCMSAVNSVPRDTDFFNDGLFRLEDDHLYGQMCQADFSQYIFSNPFENNVLGDLYRSTQTQKSPDHELMPVSSFDIGLGQDSQPLCIRAFPGSGADNPFDTFEFGSSSSRESSGEPFNRASGCPCQQQALLVLEELEVRKQKTALQFADAMLVVRRRSLTVCEAMLSCERCPMVSSNTMLIILICEKMLATYQFSPGIDFENESSTPECAKGSIGKHSEILKRRVSLGVYQIDTKHEWARLVDLLTSIQLKRLQSLLIHLRAVVESAGPESLLSVVHAHEASLKEILQASPADFNVSASRVH